MTNLDRCWKNCLRMWKWVSEVYNGTVCVGTLKEEWLADHRFTRDIDNACFFCEYQVDHGGGSRFYRGEPFCKHCPGVYVSKSFCCQSYPTYEYETNPKGFYRKLLELDKKRKQK